MKTNNIVSQVYITTTNRVFTTEIKPNISRKVTTDEVYYERPSQVLENLSLLQNPYTK